MVKPNIFSFATSELSQDAFICWLLSWSEPNCKSLDLELHQCAKQFVFSILNKKLVDFNEEINSIEVFKQDKNIDVLCIVNQKYVLLIEDKTGTVHHSDQLARYLNDVVGRGYEEQNVVPIYFKTYDQSNYSDVIKFGYYPMLRDEVLQVLNSYKGSDSILLDYRNYLQSISDKVDAYKYKNEQDWDWNSWVGFYRDLQSELGSGDWGYVANPSGGFLAFWWGGLNDSECVQYLQLEQSKLCFKISVDDQERQRSFRQRWHGIFNNYAKKMDINLVKPARFGSGVCMTVNVLNGDYRQWSEGIIDMSATLEVIKKCELLLSLARKENTE